jgi:hypothetical protein
MTRFSDLFRSGRELEPSTRQDLVERRFPAVVADSRLHAWSPGNPIRQQGKRLLLGIATYSENDMRLLDLVEESQMRHDGDSLWVDVFNTLEWKSRQDLDKYIPGLGDVYQTPVFGLWEDGRLNEQAWGKDARDRVIRLCGLDEAILRV